MIGPIKLYLSDFYIRRVSVSALALNIILFLFLLIFIRQSDVPIVLHYNVDWGVDYLSEVKSVFILPLVGLFILLFNNLLAIRLWSRSAILSYFLASTALVCQIFLALAGIALYIINS